MAHPQVKPQAKGDINVEDLVSKVRANVPANLQTIFDKAVLSGMRVMFDKSSHAMALDELNAQGPMAPKLAAGIIKLMYMLWQQSNKTLPPQIIVPITTVLTLRAFQFLLLSQDPEATKEVLGDAVADAVQGILDRFGATQDKLPGIMKAISGKAQGGALASDQPAAQKPATPAADGMLSAGA